MTPSSRGPGHRPFTAVTGVRLPLGSPNKPPSGGFLLAQSVVMIRYKYFYRVILIFGFGLVQVGLYRFWLKKRFWNGKKTVCRQGLYLLLLILSISETIFIYDVSADDWRPVMLCFVWNAWYFRGFYQEGEHLKYEFRKKDFRFFSGSFSEKVIFNRLLKNEVIEKSRL